MSEGNIINIDNNRIIECVFDRVLNDKELLEQEIAHAARLFLNKYPAFKIESLSVFDVYCGNINCVVNLQLK